jgi:hypothetical protein
VLPFAAWCALPWSFTTFLLAMAGVLAMAFGFFVASPWSDVGRSWDGSMAVAAYSCTPALLAWPLLVFPPFAFVPVIALLHSFALGYLGVQEVLECKEEEAALLVVTAWTFSALASMVAGGLCGAAGLL